MKPAHPAVVYVEWVDAGTVVMHWQDRDETMAAVPEHFEPICATGFLLSDQPEGVVLALMIDHSHDNVGHVVSIPRPAIVEIRQIMAGRSWT